MEKLEHLLERLMDRCAATGIGIIRINDGEIVYLKNTSKLPDSVIELACNAALEMFQGKLMQSMMKTVAKHRPMPDGTIGLESIKFTFSSAYHWMTLVKGKYIIVLSAPKMGISAGYTETIFRSFLPRIGMLLP